MQSTIYQRHAIDGLREALADTPVALIHGPRQCGKTTLALDACRRFGYRYLSFDDNNQLQAARADPVGFAQGLPERCALDEIQRAPELFTSLKSSVDKHRRPGRFILTGSTNVMMLPRLSDSLAGRMEIIRLRPLAQCELSGKRPGVLNALFEADFATLANGGRRRRIGTALPQLICAGGYPAALARRADRRRAIWHRDYIATVVQRDVRDIAHIRNLDALPRLLDIAATQTACLFNAAQLASPFSLSRQTIYDYLALLEQLFLIERLRPWHHNKLRRLIKRPKLHLVDTGLAASLLGVNSRALGQDRTLLGRLLETWVYQELRKQADWHGDDIRFYHFRDRDGVEVDMIMEQGRRLVGVEIKAAASVTKQDFKALKKLREVCGKQFAAGVVFYDGEDVLPFGERLFAAPLNLLAG